MAVAGFRHRVPGSLAEERASVQLALATSLLQSQPTDGLDLPLTQAGFPSPFHQGHGSLQSHRSTRSAAGAALSAWPC